MTEEKDAPHLYGTPEPNPAPPASEGLRGENAVPLADDPPELIHNVLAGGRSVTVTETSGTAFAEATGKVDGKDKAAD